MEELEDLVARRVREGFDPFEEIVGGVVENLADNYPDSKLEPLVRTAVTAAWDRAREEQAAWPVPTDCDRLDRAFAALDRSGIVARQNFSCCQNCGHVEIGREVAKAPKEPQVTGYTFYHFQDTERAAKGEGLWLAYGSIERPDSALQRAGGSVVEALRREGLTVEWDGDVRKRIRVTNLVWRRRRNFAK
jgi:hypothetical protein